MGRNAISMATVVDLYFHNVDGEGRCVPYIADEDSVQYACEQCVVGGEGTLTFDGYFYVNDAAELTPPLGSLEPRGASVLPVPLAQGGATPEEAQMQPWERPSRYSRHLPMQLRMVMQRREKEPARREVMPEGGTRYHYNVLETHDCIIEVYKRITHESTNRVSEIEDDDGEPMSVCFFPTNRQTLYFRIVEVPRHSVS